MSTYRPDETFEAESRSASAADDETAVLAISVLPLVPSTVERSDGTGSGFGSAALSTASAFFARLSSQASGKFSAGATASPPGATTTTTSDPRYVIQTTVAANFASAQSPRGASADIAGTASLATRPRIYRVTRTLSHFVWFRDFAMSKEPFAIYHSLPNRDNAYDAESIDQIVAMLLVFSSCPELKGDPLFWSLLAHPDETFERQVSSTKGASASISGQWTKVVVSKAMQLVLLHRLPRVDIKPTTISDMLMETGVLDRALMTLDKVNSCARGSFYFEEAERDNKDRLDAWSDAASRAYELRLCISAEREALLEVADAFRELSYPTYWPWARPWEDRSDSASASPNPPVAGDSAAGLPPPPSQRLTHYLHRVANIAAELGRLELGVYPDEFAGATNVVHTVVAGRSFSAHAAHERLHAGELRPRPAGRSLTDIQDDLGKLIANGTGHEELDALESMDAEVTSIQEAFDNAAATFERHCQDALGLVRSRMLRQLKELCAGEAVAWRGALLLLADLKTTLELDRFTDEEELPIFEKQLLAVPNRQPTAQEKERLREQQEVWGAQIAAFLARVSAATASFGGGGGGVSGTGGQKRRSAFREEEYDDLGMNNDRNPFDAAFEMSPQMQGSSGTAALGDAGASSHKRGSCSPDRSSTSTTAQHLPPELQQAVISSQSKFLLDTEVTADAPSVEVAAFSDDSAKKRPQWKTPTDRRSAAGAATWGSVVQDDEEDPFKI